MSCNSFPVNTTLLWLNLVSLEENNQGDFLPSLMLRILQAFADAYVILEDELAFLPADGDTTSNCSCNLLHKIIPSITILNVS